MIDFSFANSIDCYDVLGVRPDASLEEIEAAHVKVLASLSAGGFVHRLKCLWFGRNVETIRDAYQTLADTATREKYNAWRLRALSFCPPF